MEKKQDKSKYVTMIVIAIFLTFLFYRQVHQRAQINEVKKLSFTNTKVEDVADGIYEAQLKTSFFYVKLQVQVEDKKIKDIQILEKIISKDFDEETLISRIIEQNKAMVETLPKKELESLVFMCCVDNALCQGKTVNEN